MGIHKPKRSSKQRAMQMKNLAKSSRYQSADKENAAVQPRSTINSPSTSTAVQVTEMKARGDQFQKQLKVARQSNRRLRKTQVKLQERLKVSEEQNKATASSSKEKTDEDSLGGPSVEDVRSQLEELQGRHVTLLREKEKFRLRDFRATKNMDTIVEKAVDEAVESARTVLLKDTRGAVTKDIRLLVQDLIEQGVPTESIPQAIKASASRFGLSLQGDVSARSVGRIVLEGYVASKLQVATELVSASDITISCNGTSHLNTQFESKHVTLMLPGESGPITRTLGISSAPSHTSEEQFSGWKNGLAELCKLLNQLPSRASQPMVFVEDLAAKIRGMGSDHAEDQKKLSKLIRTWKTDSDRYLRGKAILLLMEASELEQLKLNEREKLVADIGGQDVWDQLTEDTKDVKADEAFHALCVRFGSEAFERFDRAEQEAIDMFIWAGCCGHKEANAVKYGDSRMRAAWTKAGIQGPIALPNKFARDGPLISSSSEPAAGAVKVTSLAGAIFNNKDDKKGQHNTTRQFFEQRLGYPLRFPDTSNTRFQSHCTASEELLVHLDLYREFMELIKDSKEKGTFTNIERNVNDALYDGATLTELAVLTLYSQAVSHPYMASVRGKTLSEQNILDLGPLHRKVAEFCQKIIDRPELLIAADASYEYGALDGQQWQRPEAIYKVHYLIRQSEVPHIRKILVAFFEGALDGWIKFSAEFDVGGTIDSTSSEHRARIFIHATNDMNEGALGALRVGLRQRPNLSLHQYNARAMYKTNQSANFINNLSPEDRQFVRQAARELDRSGVERKRRNELAEAFEANVAAKRAKKEARETKKAKRNAKLDNISVRLDLSDVEADNAAITVSQIMEQLDWHRRHDMSCLGMTELKGKTHIQKTMKKPEKIEELKAAVARYIEHQPVCTFAPESMASSETSGSRGKEIEEVAAGGFDRYGEDSDDEL